MWSSPIRPAHRHAWTSRRDWHGGTRRRSGRRPAPCRTRPRRRRHGVPSPKSSVCCDPQQAVAASSSLRPGWKTMSAWASCFFAFHSCIRGHRAASRDSPRRSRPCQASATVALALHQKHADDRLRAGKEDALLSEVELVVERDVVQRHQVFPLRRPRGDRQPTSGSDDASFLPLQDRSNKIEGSSRARRANRCTPVRRIERHWRSVRSRGALAALASGKYQAAFEQSGFGSPGSLPSTWPIMSLLSS